MVPDESLILYAFASFFFLSCMMLIQNHNFSFYSPQSERKEVRCSGLIKALETRAKVEPGVEKKKRKTHFLS